MRSDNPFRPDRRVATQTSWQTSIVNFNSVLTDATFTLDERQFASFLDIASRRIAAEYLKILEREWAARGEQP
jgi:hypothetical protein